MTNTEFLQALSDLLDEKLDQKLDEKLDEKLDAKLQPMRDDMQSMKGDMQEMKDEIRELQRKVAGIGMHIENYTDHSLQLLAENFIELTNKLNQAIPAADNNRAYEVKVNYLLLEVEKIKKTIGMT